MEGGGFGFGYFFGVQLIPTEEWKLQMCVTPLQLASKLWMPSGVAVSLLIEISVGEHPTTPDARFLEISGLVVVVAQPAQTKARKLGAPILFLMNLPLLL